MLRSFAVWSLIAVFIGYLGYFFYSNPMRLEPLLTLSAAQILFLFSLSLAIFSGLGLQLKLSVHPFARQITLYEAFQLSLINTLLNYMPLKSGVLAKGAYLKLVHKVPVEQFLVALTASQLLWIMISAGLGIVAGLPLIAVVATDEKLSFILILVVLISSLLTSTALMFSSRLPLYNHLPFRRLKGWLLKCLDLLSTWRVSRRVLVGLSLASILLFLLFALRLWVCFQFVGEQIDFLKVVLLQACIAVGFAFSVVPGNIGLKEGVLVGAAVILRVDAEPALLAALMDRVASLLPVMILGPNYLHRLGRTI